MSVISDAIDTEINNTQNKLYGGADKTAIASKMLKESINVGEAIVNVLSCTGIAGFKFHLPRREQIKLRSEITDHYTDRNNAVQDHIAQKPVQITLIGLQGEYFYSVNQIEDAVAKIIPTLSLVKQFLPKLPDGAKQKLAQKYKDITNSNETPEALLPGINKNEVNSIDIFSIFQSLFKLTSSQTRAYLFLKALWKSKAIFSVETTFERFDNMVIEDMSPLRDDNADKSEFTVVFKQMNFTQTYTTKIDGAVGRLSGMLQNPVSKGIDKGKEVSVLPANQQVQTI